MPGAISRSVYIFLSKSDKHHWIASDLDEEYENETFTPDTSPPLWVKYVPGTMHL